MAQQAKKGKKQRKYGRNANFCLRYKGSRRREHNKILKLKRHLKKFPGDVVALAAIDLCQKLIRGY